MSLENIFQALVDSRQAGGAGQPGNQDAMAQLIGGLLGGQSSGASQSNSQDAMGQLIGGLLGGAQPASTASAANGAGSQSAGLGDMMGMLEGIIGGSGQNTSASDPMMVMLQPFVNQLAQKMKISPAIATIVISFVVHKLLAHHPSSGRDSNQFNLDSLLSSGSLSTSTLQSSGMVKELSQATGLNEQASTQNLDAAFSMLGGLVKNMAAK